MNPGYVVWLSGKESVRKTLVAEELLQRLQDGAARPELLTAETLIQNYPDFALDSWQDRDWVQFGALLKSYVQRQIPVIVALNFTGEGAWAYFSNQGYAVYEVAVGAPDNKPDSQATETRTRITDNQDRTVKELVTEILSAISGNDYLTEDAGYSAEDEQIIQQRLEQLGYL